MRNNKFRNQLVKQLMQLVESRGHEFQHDKLQREHLWCDFSYIKGGREYHVRARVMDNNAYYDDGTYETDTNRAHFHVKIWCDYSYTKGGREYQAGSKSKILTATDFLKLVARHLPQAKPEAA